MKYFSNFIQKLIVYSSLPVYSSFKALASKGFEIFHWQDCIHIFPKCHNAETGHNPVKKKKKKKIPFISQGTRHFGHQVRGLSQEDQFNSISTFEIMYLNTR